MTMFNPFLVLERATMPIIPLSPLFLLPTSSVTRVIDKNPLLQLSASRRSWDSP